MAKPSAAASIDPTVELFDSMAACWPFLEGTGTTSADKKGSRSLTFYSGTSPGFTDVPTWGTNGSGDPIVNIVQSAAPIALSSSITLGAGLKSFAVAWRGTQSADDAAGMFAGDASGVNFLWMYGGGDIGRIRANGIDSDFSQSSFTTAHNYALIVDRSGAFSYATFYIDGVSAGTTSFGNDVAFTLNVDRIGNGYTGSSLALNGTLEYLYLWHDVVLTSTDAAALHANPYHGLSSSPTIALGTARVDRSRNVKIDVAGHLTEWASESPSGLFTVSGGTGASISSVTVIDDTHATFVLTPGTALGTLTVTDTSSSATDTLVVVNAFAGGILTANFAADAGVGAPDSSGRTFIMTNAMQRIRQHGPIIRVRASIGAVSGSNCLRFVVLRANGSNFDFVSESELLTPGGTGTQTFDLSSPMACQPGDFVAVWINDHCTINVRSTTVTAAITYGSGHQTGTNWNPGNTLDNYHLSIKFDCYSCSDIAIGDSRDAGHNGATSYFTLYEGWGGPLDAQPIHQQQTLVDPTRLVWQYQNYAKGSQTWSHVATTQIVDAITVYGLTPARIHAQCGVNDANLGRTWAQIEADLDTIYSIVPSSTQIEIDEILPWTAGNDTQAALIRTWNANYHTWAADKPNVKIISCHDQMAQIRSSTGQLDDMASAYDSDGVHMTVPAGVAKLASIRARAAATQVVMNIVSGFAVFNKVIVAITSGFAVRNQIAKDIVQGFAVRNQTAKDIVQGFAVRNAGVVDIVSGFAVRNQIAKDIVQGFAVRNQIEKYIAQGFAVRNAGTVDIVGGFALFNRVDIDIVQGFSVNSDGRVNVDITQGFAVRNPVVVDIVQGFAVRNPVVVDIAGSFAVRVGVVKDIAQGFAVFNTIDKDILQGFAVRNSVFVGIVQSFRVGDAPTGDCPTADEIAAATLAKIVEDGLSMRDVLRLLLAANTGATAGVGTNTERFKSVDGTKNRVVTDFDNNGNRLAVTLDAS